MTELPEEAIEAFFLGDAHDAWERDAGLSGLADHVQMGATGPAPRPSPALLVFLEEPDVASAAPRIEAPPLAATPRWQPSTAASGAPPTDRGQNVVPLFRRLRLTVGIAAAAGVAAMALAVGGTTGVLPEPVMRAVSWVVEAVSPFELHDPARPVTGGPVPAPGPMPTVRSGPFGPIGGPGPVGQGGAPGQPATPPASVPAGVPGAVRPPATNVDPAPPTSAGPITPPVPAPAVSPPAGGGSGAPSTTPPTSVDPGPARPAGGNVASTVGGAPAPRP